MLTTDPITQARELINNGDYHQAENIIISILTTNPQHPSARVLSSFLTYLKKDYINAVRQAAAVIQTDALNGEAHLIQGFALAALGQTALAIETLKRTLLITPSCTEARLQLAQLFLKQNQIEDAQYWLEKGRLYGLTDADIASVITETSQYAILNQVSDKQEIIWVDPISLLHPGRMDVIVKILYARQLLNYPNLNSTIDSKDLYLRHIYFRTGGKEPGDEGRKGNLNSFIDHFEQLIHSMQVNQFQEEFAIPVSRRTGLILNGAHRLAAAIALGLKQIPIVVRDDSEGITWGDDWFIQQGIYPHELDELIRVWISLRGPQAGCIILWPTVEEHWDKIQNQIQSIMPIAAVRTYELPRHAFAELIRDLYATDWGPIPGENIEKKIKFFENTAPKIRLLVVGLNKESPTLTALKQTLRNQWNHVVPADRFATLHTTDTPRETSYVADILLNQANMKALLCRPKNGFRAQYLTWLAQYRQAMQQYQFDPEDCCVVGSGVLEAYGVRDATDIDFTVTHRLREQFFTPGVTHLSETLDVVAKDYPRTIAHLGKAPTDEDLIRDRGLHIHVRGLKFAQLDVVITRKQMQRRPKDLADIARVSELRLKGLL